MSSVPFPASRDAVSDRLRLTREALGLSQADWCRRTGIAPNTWNNYERGVSRISLDEALKVVQATGVTLDWIYRGMEGLLPKHVADAIDATRAVPPVRDASKG